MRTFNSTTMVQHAKATAEALKSMYESAAEDEALEAHRVELACLMEDAQELARALSHAQSSLPATAWMVAG